MTYPNIDINISTETKAMLEEVNQWYEPQGKPWTLLSSPAQTIGIFYKLRRMNPKLLVRRLVMA